MASGSTSDDKFKVLDADLDEYNVSVKENRKPPIQKIPFMLKEHREPAKCLLYFEPRVVSIGPIHHGEDKFKPAEKIKRRLAAQFIKDMTQSRRRGLYNVIEDEINDLKKCYTDEVVKIFKHEELAWILFVDGCALLHFVSHVADDKLKDLNLKSDLATFAQQDLLLLENQLPYRVLELLMIKTGSKEAMEKKITHFIELTAPTQCKKNLGPNPTSSPTHLLDLLRTALVSPDNKEKNMCIDVLCSGCIDKPCALCIDKLCECLSKKKKNQETFRNIKELKAAGISVKSSQSRCLKNVDFKRRFGVLGRLMLPPIKVDDSTAPIFLNLAAYEMCPEYKNNSEISSYICFLDSLIDHPEDVKELREANVLHNLLGSDDEVATLFNEISTDLVPNVGVYEKVKGDIQSHFDQRCFTWMAQVYHEHFSSPWTILAFFGVILGLVLSFLQTIYSMK